MAYGGENAVGNQERRLLDKGWIPCDGRQLDREAFEELYAVISTNFGTPDSETLAKTFFVPDLRGRFLRGVSSESDDSGEDRRDPDGEQRTVSAPNSAIGNKVGSFQSDSVKLPEISILKGKLHNNHNEYKGNIGIPRGINRREGRLTLLKASGNETRPKNVNVNWIIKAKSSEAE